MKLRILLMVCRVSERWLEECRKALETLCKLSEKERKDRLERVKSIKTSLTLLGRSLSGWSRWMNNPDTMAYFSLEELKEMEEKLSVFSQDFIEFDMKATKLGLEKGLKRKRVVERKQIRFVI